MSDPKTYDEAMLDVDSKKWMEVMKLEIDSMYSNHIQTLVDPSEDIVPLSVNGSTKEKSDQMVKQKPIRQELVAKVYSQHEGIDYQKIFSPMVLLKSIRTLLTVVAYIIIKYDRQI